MKADFTPQVKALIVDMDGVIWRGDQPIGDIPGAMDHLKKMGYQVVFATNNSTRTPEMYVERFKKFGVVLEENQIITSAMACAYLLAKQFPSGGPVHIVGEAGLRQALQARGFYHADENVIAVVVGMDREANYRMLTKACLLIRKGAPFFATNPDKTFPLESGIGPGAGSLLALIETATDQHPTVAGKPFPFMMEMALEELGLQPREALVVGDRLDTDISGGQNAGCRTALVLSGISTLEEAQRFEPVPDLIVDDLVSLAFNILPAVSPAAHKGG